MERIGPSVWFFKLGNSTFGGRKPHPTSAQTRPSSQSEQPHTSPYWDREVSAICSRAFSSRRVTRLRCLARYLGSWCPGLQAGTIKSLLFPSKAPREHWPD